MPEAGDDYDRMGEKYAEHAAEGPVNAQYDRPAILALAGDVRGRRVLDVGCAAGALSEALVDRGADVLGIDASRVMIAIAERRLGERARFRVADLRAPLDFVPTGSIDVVTASLVMHYLEDWGPALREIHRALAPDGRMVLSIHHPGEDWRWFDRPDYFATEPVTDHFPTAAGPAEVHFFRRPLGAVFAAVRDACFWVDELAEPMPLPEVRDRDPRVWTLLTTAPRFLYLRLLKRGRP
jgi:SAM-dependent methyltransferase